MTTEQQRQESWKFLVQNVKTETGRAAIEYAREQADKSPGAVSWHYIALLCFCSYMGL
jgi:hypothetical protein